MSTITDKLAALVAEYDNDEEPFDSAMDMADMLTEVMAVLRPLVATPRAVPLCVIHTDAAPGDEPTPLNTTKTEYVLSISWAADGTPQLHTGTEQISLTGRRITFVHGQDR